MKIRQYLLFNKEIELSSGKWGAQAAHVASRFERAVSKGTQIPLFNASSYNTWINDDEMKITVRASLALLEKLEQEGWIGVRDNGHTEVAPNTLTAIISPPLSQDELPKYLKRLQLFK